MLPVQTVKTRSGFTRRTVPDTDPQLDHPFEGFSCTADSKVAALSSSVVEQQVERTSTRRRIKLSSNTHWQVATIGAVTGSVLTFLGVSPTGSAPLDLLVLVAAAAFGTWTACTAPWWLLVASSTVSTALNPLGAGTVVGLAGIGVSAWVGMQQRSNPVIRAGAAALVMVSFAFVGNLFQFGISTAIAMIVVGSLCFAGLRRRPRADRRLAMNIVAVTTVAIVGVVAIAALSGFRARNNLRSANQHANSGLKAMRSADFETASTEFKAAADEFARTNNKLTAPWVQPVRLVPLAAQQWRAVDLVSNTAADASMTIGENAGAVDLDRLKINNGQIDVSAIQNLEQPLEDVRGAVGSLGNAVDAARSPWLLPQISDRLDELADDVDRQQVLGDNALDAVKLAPAILGADGTRNYFLMITTPAEARGQGGFMGSFAEISITDGKIAIVTMGRPADLNDVVNDKSAQLPAAPQDWMDTWGQYWFRGSTGELANDVWSIVGMSAHFPNTAQVIQELYPQSGGREIDGVFSLDAYGVEALVGLVGPLEVDTSPVLTGENTAEFILLDQYVGLSDTDLAETNENRTDMLSSVAEVAIDRLLTSNPPDPVQLGQALFPLGKEGRVLAWAADPDEEALFEQIGIDGRILGRSSFGDDQTPSQGVQVVVNNALGNKIDSFLRRTTKVEGDRVSIDFTNTAPTGGLPRYVIGTNVDAAPAVGTNRMIVTIYTTGGISEPTVNGEPISAANQTEAGVSMHTFSLEIASGETATLSFVTNDGTPYVVDQPLVRTPVAEGG